MDSTKGPKQHGSAKSDVALPDLAEGARRVFENASDLYDEAVLLGGAGAACRALSLHQISLEECAKVDMLGAWAVGLLMGQEVNRKDLQRAFSNHKTKNFTNAYLRPPDDVEREAKQDKRWSDALDAFKVQQRLFHRESNAAKNASLYVDITDEGFLTPKDQITESMVLEMRAENERYLTHASMYVRMLARWEKAPELLEDILDDFETTMKTLRAQTDDFGEALSSLMDALWERAVSTGYATHMIAPSEDEA